MVIERLVVDGQEIYTGNDVLLAAGSQRFEVHYTAPSLLKPKSLKFQYRLVRVDSEWVDGGDQRAAHYTHLPPGRYRFEVKARSSDGVWSDSAKTIDFQVAAHFYQTHWF